MSTDNNIAVTDDLDAFSAELFQSKVPEKEQTPQDDANDAHADEEDTLAPDENANVGESKDEPHDDGSDEEEDLAEPEDKGEPEPKPHKNRFQERIDQAVGKQREAERRATELEQKLAEAIEQFTKANTKPEVKPTPKNEDSQDTGPKPTDENEDGTEKYLLGEFDPAYITDLVKHNFAQETRSREEQVKQEREQATRDQAEAELQSQWNEKLTPAKERYPDFQEKGEQMLSVFQEIEPAYGEYLTNTIMEMEHGPDVFYYLATHVDEAQKIVNAGAKKATLALGALETKFANSEEVKQNRIVTKAPPPPEHQNRGTRVVALEVPDDTDDLDAFSAKLFKKRGR